MQTKIVVQFTASWGRIRESNLCKHSIAVHCSLDLESQKSKSSSSIKLRSPLFSIAMKKSNRRVCQSDSPSSPMSSPKTFLEMLGRKLLTKAFDVAPAKSCRTHSINIKICGSSWIESTNKILRITYMWFQLPLKDEHCTMGSTYQPFSKSQWMIKLQAMKTWEAPLGEIITAGTQAAVCNMVLGRADKAVLVGDNPFVAFVRRIVRSKMT